MSVESKNQNKIPQICGLPFDMKVVFMKGYCT